jgi:hypothetical protein
MVLFALTNITMDITLGVAWWVVKNTVYGTYCLGSYLFCTTEPPKEEKEMLELKYQIAELNKKLDRISSMTDLTTPQIIQPIEDKIVQTENIKSHTDVEDAFVLVDE